MHGPRYTRLGNRCDRWHHWRARSLTDRLGGSRCLNHWCLYSRCLRDRSSYRSGCGSNRSGRCDFRNRRSRRKRRWCHRLCKISGAARRNEDIGQFAQGLRLITNGAAQISRLFLCFAGKINNAACNLIPCRLNFLGNLRCCRFHIAGGFIEAANEFRENVAHLRNRCF